MIKIYFIVEFRNYTILELDMTHNLVHTNYELYLHIFWSGLLTNVSTQCIFNFDLCLSRIDACITFFRWICATISRICIQNIMFMVSPSSLIVSVLNAMTVSLSKFWLLHMFYRFHIFIWKMSVLRLLHKNQVQL